VCIPVGVPRSEPIATLSFKLDLVIKFQKFATLCVLEGKEIERNLYKAGKTNTRVHTDIAAEFLRNISTCTRSFHFFSIYTFSFCMDTTLRPVRLNLSARLISHVIVFFSHNKTALAGLLATKTISRIAS
jgi:hypothetical protein